MADLLAARSQMAVSLAFHIVFAMVGIGMPVLMVLAEVRYARTRDAMFLDLARRWAKGTAILFAVGAVSGTVLSFELGLLWPEFMRFAGGIIGMPFSLEGFAFFTEAIFLSIYLYGWDRVSRRAHIAAGVLVAVSGALSAIFVIMANAWMNTPQGFRLVDGRPVDIDPIAAMLNPAFTPQALHMLLAAYAATGFAVAGIHAWFVLKQPKNPFHRHAMSIALRMAVPAALLQPFSGDLSARLVAKTQPAKLAAMEGHFTTQARAPLHIGGWPDVATRTTRFAIAIPGGLSFLAFGDLNAEVQGLDRIPEEDWPPVPFVHIAFQVMVGLGLLLVAISVWAIWLAVRRANFAQHPWLLRGLVAMVPAGFIATEAGWVVTEVGRQPWIIQGVLRTRDAVTPMPGLVIPFLLFTALYVFLGVIVLYLLARQMRRVPTISTPVAQGTLAGDPT